MCLYWNIKILKKLFKCIFKQKKNNLHTIPNTYFTKVAFNYCLEIEKMKTLETEMCLIKKRDIKINLFMR
jgi:hypothetical protein